MSVLAKADAQIKALVHPCRSAMCFGRYRVRGLEYDTGGCLDYEEALQIAREMDELGGPGQYLKKHGRIRLDGSKSWPR